MIVVDASVLIAATKVADVHHERALRFFATDELLVAHPVTLGEYLVLPARLGRHNEAAALLREHLRVEQAAAAAAMDAIAPTRTAMLRAETGLKMPDVIVLSLALRLDASIATFDAALHQVAEVRGLALAI